MTSEDNYRKELTKYRIEQAEETITDVQLLIENERLRAAINRIYYGIFYSLLALGIANGFKTSKHSQLIGWFNKNFIKEGLIEPKYGKIVNKAFNRRIKGDYDSFVEFEKDIVIEMFNEMQEFILEIKKYLQQLD